MPSFEFQDHKVFFQKVRYTVVAADENDARRLIASQQVTTVPDGPAVLIHAGEFEPYQPKLIATVDGAGCPVWRTARDFRPRAS